MVQRKVQNKIGIKPNPIKTNNQIVNHKSSFPSQNHDIKNNKGVVADLKKKMMKKKSAKTNFTRRLPQPGKPPPKQQQQQPTPNYMKSTSSSVARKEQSQVSSKSLQTYPTSNKSKLGSASSVNKPTRSLASLKLVRTTLTKTPSFKQIRATCSSTLKEAKFPSYLKLSPGGTESNGSSVFKVCPYTYCSLNGHHHPPLPPLKCFLSAKRRSLKTQRHFKLGCLSSRRANPHGLGLSDNVPKEIICTTEVAPLANEDDRESFVEIYSKEKEEISDPIGPNIKLVDEYNTSGSASDVDQRTEATSADIDIPGFCPAEYLNEGINMPPMVQEEGHFESVCMHNELEIEDSEASDMDWDVDKYYAYSEGEMDPIPNGTEPITLVDDSVVSKEFTEKSSDSFLEEPSDKESIISGPCYGYDESQSDCSDAEFNIDGCVEVTGDALSLDVGFILDGEVAEKSEDERGETARTDSQAVVMDDEISVSHEECATIPDDEEMALIAYQELNVCNFNEAQDKRSTKSNGGNIVVKMEDAETKTNCCEEGYGIGHGLKSKTKEDHTSDQADDVTENAFGVEANPTAEACAKKVDQIKDKNTYVKYASGEELSESYTNLRCNGRRNNIKETEESREFNPRPPIFLPVEPDPEAEKVDLKHQMMDDRKNAEDWMLDFALRRAVDKLAPARKRKVALLVEAFETVLPTSKWEPHLRRSAAGFAHPRPIQACR